jgi:hypothetical protein
MNFVETVKQRLGLVEVGSIFGAVLGLIVSIWIAHLAEDEYDLEEVEEDES